MTDAEVLKKAIERAREKGYEGVVGELDDEYTERLTLAPALIVFDHSFAKAFWKAHKVRSLGSLANPIKMLENWAKDEGEMVDAWQFHLQAMVLYENPIDYLRKFVEEEA